MIRTVWPRLKLQCLLCAYTDVKCIRTSSLQQIGASPKGTRKRHQKRYDTRRGIRKGSRKEPAEQMAKTHVFLSLQE